MAFKCYCMGGGGGTGKKKKKKFKKGKNLFDKIMK
jgi:hypothetical protein